MSDPHVGRVLAGKYELIRLLGQGGMGAVYEGRNQIGKRVAVKLLLKAELSQNKEVTARFFREAQASAAAESRHVVDVYDTGIDADTAFPFIIMAYLAGEDLDQVVKRIGPLNPLAAARIVSQAATGLAKAHEAGIIHRDIKPANLFLAKDEEELVVKVLDFGIAKVATDGLGGGGENHALTHTGAMMGTPLYMSPEQAQGLKTVDARTDVWSLGMCLYEALAGRLPFDDVDTIGKLVVAIVAHEVRPLREIAPWVRPELAAVVRRSLDRDVDARIGTAREFVAALAPFLNGVSTLTPSAVVGVQETLDATINPAASAVPVPRAPALVGAATTSGVASEASPARESRSSRKALPLIVGGLATLLIAGLAVGRLGGMTGTPAAPSASAATARPQAFPSQAASAPSTASAPDEEERVGMLRVKIPDGYTVKVDGAPRAVEHGLLELRGEFQRKFLIAVFDRSQKRVMMQEVYLYNNVLDPETVDTSVGSVAVEKPKRRTAVAPSAAPLSAPSASSRGELPARF